MKYRVVAALLLVATLTGCVGNSGADVTTVEGPDGPTSFFVAEKTTDGQEADLFDSEETVTDEEAEAIKEAESIVEELTSKEGESSAEELTSEDVDSSGEAKSLEAGDSVINNDFVYVVPKGYVSFFSGEEATYLLRQDRSAEIWITGQSAEEVGDVELSDDDCKYVVTYSLSMLMIANGFGEGTIVGSSPFTTKNGIKGIRIDFESDDGKACAIGLWTGKSLSMPFVISKMKNDDDIATFVAMVDAVTLENE